VTKYTGVIGKLAFISIALTVCLAASLRTIPSLVDSNDTGRYVFEFNRLCTQQGMAIEQPDKIVYYEIVRPICITRSERIYLFVAALPLPLSLLLFGKWRRNTFIWAFALFFSVSAFELATNALRQGASILFLIWSLYLVSNRKKIAGIIIWLLSFAVHISAAIYGPLIYFYHLEINKGEKNTRKIYIRHALLIALFGLASVIFIRVITLYLVDLTRIYSTYRLYYEEEKSVLFILFMVAPTIMVYLVRLIIDRNKITKIETYAFMYSSFVILATILVFPAIAYRLTMTSFVIQAYLALSAKERTGLAGSIVAILSIAHLLIFLSKSSYAQNVLFS